MSRAQPVVDATRAPLCHKWPIALAPEANPAPLLVIIIIVVTHRVTSGGIAHRLVPTTLPVCELAFFSALDHVFASRAFFRLLLGQPLSAHKALQNIAGGCCTHDTRETKDANVWARESQTTGQVTLLRSPTGSPPDAFF